MTWDVTFWKDRFKQCTEELFQAFQEKSFLKFKKKLLQKIQNSKQSSDLSIKLNL